MSTPRIIARNICSNWANMVVSMVISFSMMPFLVHRLGNTFMGHGPLVVSLVGYEPARLRVRSSIVKYVSPCHATDDRDRLRSLFTTTPALCTAIGALVLFLCRRDFGYA